jgi:hypothetical protein
MFYKDLFFSVFNITHTKNKVSVKYITKNITTDSGEVFLPIKNQTSANINSSRNLRVTETRVCIVWLPGSLSCPLIKITRAIKAITVNSEARRIISINVKPG